MIKKLKIGRYSQTELGPSIVIVETTERRCKYYFSNTLNSSYSALSAMINHLNRYGYSLSDEEEKEEEDYEVH